jgi:hypothetical protein
MGRQPIAATHCDIDIDAAKAQLLTLVPPNFFRPVPMVSEGRRERDEAEGETDRSTRHKGE